MSGERILWHQNVFLCHQSPPKSYGWLVDSQSASWCFHPGKNPTTETKINPELLSHLPSDPQWPVEVKILIDRARMRKSSLIFFPRKIIGGKCHFWRENSLFGWSFNLEVSLQCQLSLSLFISLLFNPSTYSKLSDSRTISCFDLNSDPKACH